MRYQIKAWDIQKRQLGQTVEQTDDSAEAKRYAEAHGTEFYDGLIIIDQQAQTVDIGESGREAVPLKQLWL